MVYQNIRPDGTVNFRYGLNPRKRTFEEVPRLIGFIDAMDCDDDERSGASRDLGTNAKAEA
jgi:hypothetical protein